MVFNSYTFIIFFILVLALHSLPLSWKVKKINLLLAGYIFYAAWNPPFIILLWLSTIIDYFVGKALYQEENSYKKRLLLMISLIGNLGMLCFFKYGVFLLDNFVLLMHAIGVHYQPAKPNIILPAGISFYTFTTLCYTIDMYKKHSQPVKSLLDFSLFVTFFPHLVAGPIVRPEQLVPQFEKPHTATQQQLMKGLFLFSLGLVMKVVFADTLLASTADLVFNAPMPLKALDSWTGVFAFSGQIFFDFAGYSTCAIGIALCLGFVLPENFRYPYAAIGPAEFWKRWHITLSTWLRDYLYIPLGGNRKGELKTYVNLMITMLLGGLWHGASWTFVVWGMLHGFYLWVEKFWIEKVMPTRPPHEEISGLVITRASIIPAFIRSQSLSNFILAFLTFMLVNITWVFFRAPDFKTAMRLLVSMTGQMPVTFGMVPTIDILKVAVVISLMIATHWLMRNTSVLKVTEKISWPVLGLGWALLLIALIISQKSSDSFIYFQF